MLAFGEATEWLNAEPLGPAELRSWALREGLPGAEAFVFTVD